MTNLLRSASFGRRRSGGRTQEPAAEPDESGHTMTAAQGLLRKASFGRRNRGGQQSERSTTTHGGPALGTTESEGSSSPAESDLPDDRPMRGWLSKRHNKDSAFKQLDWAMRFFAVDDVRGTLAYSKGEKRKPSAILPLADISKARRPCVCCPDAQP